MLLRQGVGAVSFAGHKGQLLCAVIAIRAVFNRHKGIARRRRKGGFSPAATGRQRRMLGIGFQRLSHRIINRFENRSFVGKFDLQLSGMHIDIHAVRTHFQIQNANRVFFGRYVGDICLLQGGGCRLALDIASVDKEILCVAACLGIVRTPNHAVHAHTRVRVVHKNQAFRKLLAVHRPDNRAQLPVPCRFQLDRTVANQAHRNFGMRKCNLFDSGGNRQGFGCVPLEKLATRGDIDK